MHRLKLGPKTYISIKILISILGITFFNAVLNGQNTCLIHELASFNMDITNSSYLYQMKKKSFSSMDTSFYEGKVILKSYDRLKDPKNINYSLHDFTLNFDFILTDYDAVYNPKDNKSKTIFISKRKKIKKFIEGNRIISDAVIWHNGILNRHLSSKDVCQKDNKSGMEIIEIGRNDEQITFSIIFEPSKMIKSAVMNLTFNIQSKHLENIQTEFVDEFGRKQYTNVQYSWDRSHNKVGIGRINFDYKSNSLNEVQLYDLEGKLALPFELDSIEMGVIIYIWHSGCRPCIETLLKIDSDLLPKIEKRGLKFVAINPYDFQNEKGVTSSAKKILNRLGNPSWSYFTIADFRPANSNYMPQIFLYEADLHFVKEGGSIQELLKYAK